MLTQNKFTILIPTRERCDTLYHTIRTCLNQTYENLEVIVSDNCSQDNTKKVVMSFSDSRLKYINTGKRLSMSGNFDFALTHVNDGYVMFIGDDDGILPDSLEYVNDIINNTGCEAVVSHNALYIWPQEFKSSLLNWSPKKGYEVRRTKEWLQKYFKFRMPYTFDLPGAYCGFVKCDVLNRIKKDNVFFRSATPDAYSAIAVSFFSEKYVYSYTPFAIHGSSARSNGGAYLSSSKKDERDEAKLFFKENSIPFHKNIIMTKSFRICSIEAYLQFSDYFPELTKHISVDWKKLLQYVLTERNEATKDTINKAVKDMCGIHGLDYEEVSSTIPNKFAGISFNEFVLKVFHKLKCLIVEEKTSFDNLTNYNVYNIYDAVIFLDEILSKKA